MKRIVFIFLITLVAACSCDSEVRQADVVNVPVESNASLADFISSCDEIVLENNEKNILANVDKLRVYEDKLYVMDKQANAIFVYDNNGKFAGRLSRQGRGPQEYLYISDFDIFQGKMYVLSRSDKKIVIYNADMSYVSDIKLNDWYNNLFVSDSNSIFLYSEKSNKQGFDIVVIDANGEVQDQYLPFANQDSFCFSTSPFNSYKDGGAFVTLPYESKVYCLVNGKFSLGYEFNFLTPDHVENIDLLTYPQIRDQVKGKEVLKRIEYIAQNDERVLLVCSIFFENVGYRQLLVLLDNNTKEVKVLRLNDELDKNYPFFGSVIAVHDEMLYSYTNTMVIAGIKNYMNENKGTDVEKVDDCNFVVQVSKIKFK